MPTEPFDVLHPISAVQLAEPLNKPALVSVVVPCCGQLEYTRLCVSSLLRHSRRPYELIFVDLESMDGTADYLAGVLAAASVPVQVLRLSGNAGFAEALNRGIALANGEYVVFLNNDTIVTSHWLEHLLALADSSATIGLVGAMSNCVPAPQSVGAIPYRLTTGSVSAFGLHNFAYRDARVFQDVDHVVVPSEFSRQWYEQRLGLKCHVLPYCIDFSRVESPKTRVESQRGRQASEAPLSSLNSEPDSGSQPSAIRSQLFLTFVNPQPAKGLFVFARIVEQLQRRRPEIPILVVESRGAASWLEQTGLDLSWCQNLHAMENTHDPRDFYRVTKLLLVPSLWNESFGLVAAEAMINGIPVLASDRGALPEVMGRVEGGGRKAEGGGPEGIGGQRSRIRRQPEEAAGGFLFDIPSRYTPETAIVPTAEEVEPWVETIIRLWDDETLYRECSEKARAHAQLWHPDRLGPMYAEFFRNVRPQPEPPVVRSQGLGIRDHGGAVIAEERSGASHE